MEKLRSLAGPALLIAALIAVWLILVPKRYYEPGHSLMTVEYRLSDMKCYCMPHDRWGQWPLICKYKNGPPKK